MKRLQKLREDTEKQKVLGKEKKEKEKVRVFCLSCVYTRDIHTFLVEGRMSFHTTVRLLLFESRSSYVIWFFREMLRKYIIFSLKTKWLRGSDFGRSLEIPG